MKTKKLLLVFCVLFFFIGMKAQTYYYNTTKTFNENGYTYQCDVTSGSKEVRLYNKSNQFTYILPKYKDGSPLAPRYWDKYVHLLEDDNWTKPLCNSIVNNAFSTAEKLRVKGRELSVTMYINPDNGRVSEVKFWFLTDSPYATIPVSVYRTIETNLKNQIWFTSTTEGKKFNYVMRFWRHEVK